MKIKTVLALSLLCARVPSLWAGESDFWSGGSDVPVGRAALRRAGAADQEAPGSWGTHMAVGFQYPGVSARVTYRHLVLEGLYMQQDHADVAGPRLYYFFNPGSRVVFNAGGEYGWVSGKTDLQRYTGKALTGFLGMEMFASRRISVGIDMGYCRVSLSGDTKTDVAENSLVANLGLHVYL